MVGVYWEHPRKMDDDWGDPHFRKAPHAAGKIHQEMDVAMDVAMVDVAMFDPRGYHQVPWCCPPPGFRVAGCVVNTHGFVNGKSWEIMGK